MNHTKGAHRLEWLYYRMIADETGDTPFDVYLTVAKMYLTECDVEGNLVVRKPTSLNSTEHSDYLEKIYCFASTFLGMVLPDPNERPTATNHEYHPFDR